MDGFYTIVFWAAIALVIFSGALGIVSIWMDGFWRSSMGPKTFGTAVVLACTTIAAAMILKWLRG